LILPREMKTALRMQHAQLWKGRSHDEIRWRGAECDEVSQLTRQEDELCLKSAKVAYDLFAPLCQILHLWQRWVDVAWAGGVKYMILLIFCPHALALVSAVSLKYLPKRIFSDDFSLSELKQVNASHLDALPRGGCAGQCPFRNPKITT
jgi:hypothetical protein